MLQFDAETTRLLEIAYQGRDITRRRHTSLEAVALNPGERVIDIGCGNGLMTAEIARAVGASGKVLGIDPSDDMRAPALSRCKEYPWVDIVDGTAEALPVADGWADAALSLQVFEYLEDVPAALTEVHRALKPGGRVAIGDMMFETLSWFSDDPERMQRMIASWDQHLAERNLPAKLPALMRDAGFVVDRSIPFTFCDNAMRPDGIANMTMALMERYAVANEHVPSAEAKAWAEEQRTLANEGRFFFTLTHVVTVARKI